MHVFDHHILFNNNFCPKMGTAAIFSDLFLCIASIEEACGQVVKTLQATLGIQPCHKLVTSWPPGGNHLVCVSIIGLSLCKQPCHNLAATWWHSCTFPSWFNHVARLITAVLFYMGYQFVNDKAFQPEHAVAFVPSLARTPFSK